MSGSTLFRWSGLLVWTLLSAGGDDPPNAGKIYANDPEAPYAESFSLKRGVEAIDKVALDWTREKKCGSCHTNYAYMVSRSSVKGKMTPEFQEVRRFFEGRVAGWDGVAKGAKPLWDAEVVATASVLAIDDALSTNRLSPSARKALDRMWSLQRADGAWNWLKCDWAPFEKEDAYGAVFAAVAVSLAPDDYQHTEPARAGVEKLRDYLRRNPDPYLHHRAYRLWASLRLDGVMSREERDQTIKDLLAVRRPDGGWSLPSLGDWNRRDGTPNDKAAVSDAYATGLVVHILSRPGLGVDPEVIRSGIAWLKSHQRESGKWFTKSLNNDADHFISNAGTAFAILAISSCEPESPVR